MPFIVGIDLGTTNSLVAVMRDDRPEIIPDAASGAPLLPSAVSLLPDGSFLVGAGARRRASLHPRSGILSAKRFMGLGGDHLDAADRERYRFAEDPKRLAIVLESEGDSPARAEITPVEVSSLILRELKRRAEHVPARRSREPSSPFPPISTTASGRRPATPAASRDSTCSAW